MFFTDVRLVFQTTWTRLKLYSCDSDLDLTQTLLCELDSSSYSYTTLSTHQPHSDPLLAHRPFAVWPVGSKRRSRWCLCHICDCLRVWWMTTTATCSSGSHLDLWRTSWWVWKQGLINDAQRQQSRMRKGREVSDGSLEHRSHFPSVSIRAQRVGRSQQHVWKPVSHKLQW